MHCPLFELMGVRLKCVGRRRVVCVICFEELLIKALCLGRKRHVTILMKLIYKQARFLTRWWLAMGL
jgi:hypothetical protein